AAWPWHREEFVDQDRWAAARRCERVSESPVFERSSHQRGEAVQLASQGTECRGAAGYWRESGNDPNDPDRADTGRVLGVHNIPARAGLPQMVAQETLWPDVDGGV